MKIHRSLGLCVPLLFCLGAGAAAQDSQNPAASVTVLLMTTDIQVAADGSDTRTQHVEIRAGNDAGAQQIGQISIAFDSTAQDLTVVEAHTLKPDGKTLPVETSAIYDQAPPGQTALIVTGLRGKLIVFPQFAVGDTAVYTIRTITRHPNFTGQFFYAELFARTQAFNEVRETITAPKSLPLSVESHDVEASRREDGDRVIYSWHYAAPKPVAQVPVTFSPLDHTPRFFVSSFRDYAQMGQAYAALTEPKRVVTARARALADEITAGTSEPRAQAQKIYEWVNSHIRYVGIELGTGSFVPRDVDAIVTTGYGDCKDHDLLLQVLLKARGIDSRSILINGSDIYTLTDAPTFTTLDHVITFVPQFNLYLDSSAGLAPFGILPLQEYGKPMVVASAASTGQGRMPVLAPGVGKITLKTVAALDKNGDVTGTTTTTASGPYAIALRGLGLQIQAAGPAAADRLLRAGGHENGSGAFTLGAPTSLSADYTIAATFKWTGWAEYLTGKTSFFMPPALRLLGQSGDGIMGPFDPGTLPPGEPTLCFSAEQSEDLSLKAPPGIPFDGKPNDLTVETPNLTFVAHWSLEGDTMSVHRDFTSKIDTPLCTGAVRSLTATALKRIADSYDVAISFVDKTGDAATDAVTGLYKSAYAHLDAKEYDLAIADLDKGIALKPEEAYLYNERGLAHLRLRQFPSALADFNKAIALYADRTGAQIAYANRGWVEAGQDQFDLALADADKALAVKADYADAYRLRGIVKGKQRQYPAAIAAIEKFAALTPENPESLDMLAGLHLALNQFALAVADYDKLIALQPDDINAVSGRAFAHSQAKQYALAIADYDKVIAKKPNSAQAYLYRGGAKNSLGQKAEGERDIATAIKLDPSLAK